MSRMISTLLLAGFFGTASAPAQSQAPDKQNAKPAACAGPYCADTSRQFKPETVYAPPRPNQIFRDPEFGSRLIRITDESGIDGNLPGFSFGTNSGGEANEWGKLDPSLGPNGGYYFYITTSGGGVVPFSMDAATMQVTPHCGGLKMCRLQGDPSFSYVDPKLLYGHFGSNNLIAAYNIASGKQTTVYDLNKCSNLPDDLSGYPAAISNSGDDTKFANYSGGKMQGWGHLVTFYDRSSDHCYWYDTATGRLGGSDMATVQVKQGVLPPPSAPRLSSTSGNLPAGDYYVQLSINTLLHPDLGETLPSPEAHIHLNSTGGIAISPPEIDNPYRTNIKGYSVYIGTAPGQEQRQASALPVQNSYNQSAPLSKGPSPPKTGTAGFDVHNARVSRDGKVVKIIPQAAQALYLWMPGTTNISACSTRGEGHAPELASFCGGHTVLGYTHLINADGPGSNASLLMRPMSDLNHAVQLLPPEISVPLSMDVHWSWNNADPMDSTPVCGTYSRSSTRLQGDGTRNPATNPVIADRQAWDREVVCAATSVPPKVWRFAHHHATGACNASAKDGSCFMSIAIGNVSQDGKFFLFSSDWDWSLGSDPHNPGCPTSGRCRVDAFIVELK
ncbi:MAG TPA: hypothetical protein VN310_04695 [Candidatus Dormibacteraeota bacterium]|nr:hypothetical protein [Candidatus Dormibacteraeota bacterium]